jgi:hypothetical protein
MTASWDNLKIPTPADIAAKEAEKAMREDEIRACFITTFSSEAGKRCLEIMREWTEGRALVPEHCGDGVAMTNLTYMAIGELNFYKKIKKHCKPREVKAP